MSVEGSLDLFSLPEILQMISQQGKTGILTIQGQQDIVAISFLAGRIVAADSLAHTVEEGLAKLLVGEGLLSAAELARAGAEHQASGGRLLDLLVERRYLTRPQLLAALRLQTIRQLEALLRWQAGDFKFYGGDEVSYEEGFQPISVEDLLLRTLADFAGPSSPAPQPRPPSAATAATARGGAAAGPAAVAPKPRAGAAGEAAGDRRREIQTEAAGGELRLPEVPELPDVSTSPSAAPRGTEPRPAVPRRSPVPPASPASPLPLVPPAAGGPLGAAVPAAPAAPATREAAAPVLDPPGKRPVVSALPSLPFAAPAPTVPAAPAAAPDDLAASGASAASAPAPWPAGLPSSTPGSAPASDPVPWPAAALVNPPAPPAPVRPRATATGVVRPPGLSAPGGSIQAPGATARAGTMWTPAVVAPDAPPAGSAGRSGALPAAGGRRPAALDGQPAAGEDRRASSPGGLSPEGSPGGPLPSRFRQMQIERPGRLVPLAHRVAAAALAVAAAVALVVAARQAPERMLLSLPWEQGERTAFVRNQRESLYAKIETAAKTACLRDGRFSDQLGQLRDSGLLSPADLTDPGGEPLLYSVREDGYTLQATEAGKPLADADTSASSVGNFLLDPSFSQTSPQKGPPIVLLD
jgi:Domain of unknown function (DUF4388)